jgi:hypothetical protein
VALALPKGFSRRKRASEGAGTLRYPILLGVALSFALHEVCRGQELHSVVTETTIDNSLVGHYRVEDEKTTVTIEPVGDELVVKGRLEEGLPEELRGPRTASAPLLWVFPVKRAETRGVDGVLARVQAGSGSSESVELRPKEKGRVEGEVRKDGQVVARFTLVRHAATVKLYLYPGESTRLDGTTTGHIYVVGGKGESYEIAAGPAVSSSEVGPGGHSVGVTPAGTYTLGAQAHHTTPNWPMSSIPWGAKLEEKADGLVYYSIVPGKWVAVTGPDGVFTKSLGQFFDQTPAELRARVRREDYVSQTGSLYADGKLISPWTKNDFGEWSWDLERNGERSPYYIHTTPGDEARYRAGKSSDLANSHGCVHIHPKDRDEMMAKGYLSAGVEVIVKPYGQLGPPGASKKQLNNALGE